MSELLEFFKQDHTQFLTYSWKHNINTYEPRTGEVISTGLYVHARLHLDFSSNSVFATYYVPESQLSIEQIGKVVINPKKIEEELKKFIIETKMPYSSSYSSSKNMIFTNKIYIYYDGQLDDIEKQHLEQKAKAKSLSIELRDREYAEKRLLWERPMAFISHDSRDKEAIAKPLAQQLILSGCSVWYDEFSLRPGDHLRESIQDGLKSSKKCILLLSKNFLNNNGWTKKEFNSVFHREILEKENVMLPIWCGVSKEEIYEYSPDLLDYVALNLDSGIEEIANKLAQELKRQ